MRGAPPWQVTVAVLALGAVWYASKMAAESAQSAAGAVIDALNPVSDKNLAYRGVNSVGGVIAGNPTWSLGSATYELMHPWDADPTAPVKSVDLIKASGGGFDVGNGQGW